MSGPALTSLTAIPTVAEGDTARSNAKSMPPYPYGWRLRSRLCLMPCLDASASYFHRRHSTHRLIPRHCHEDSGVPFFYTPQTSPLGATRCVPQRDLRYPHFAKNLFARQTSETTAPGGAILYLRSFSLLSSLFMVETMQSLRTTLRSWSSVMSSSPCSVKIPINRFLSMLKDSPKGI